MKKKKTLGDWIIIGIGAVLCGITVVLQFI